MPSTKPLLATLITFPTMTDGRGDLVALETNTPNVPFTLKRVYYITNVPQGQDRGGHAHKALEGVLIATSGTIDITVDNGHDRESFTLDSPHKGLHLEAGLWREMSNFSEGAVLMVLASEVYDEADYIRDYQAFLEWVKQ